MNFSAVATAGVAALTLAVAAGAAAATGGSPRIPAGPRVLDLNDTLAPFSAHITTGVDAGDVVSGMLALHRRPGSTRLTGELLAPATAEHAGGSGLATVTGTLAGGQITLRLATRGGLTLTGTGTGAALGRRRLSGSLTVAGGGSGNWDGGTWVEIRIYAPGSHADYCPEGFTGTHLIPSGSHSGANAYNCASNMFEIAIPVDEE